MDQTTDIRLAALKRLLHEDPGPERGRKSRLARRIKKSAAQISQWLSSYRTIDDVTAREIEASAGKPRWWMDQPTSVGALASTPAAVPTLEPPLPSIADALEVLGIALARDMPADVRDDLADALAKLVKRHGAARDQAQVLALLRDAPGKRHTGT